MPEHFDRVMIIGNGGGGKTTLAYKLAECYQLSLTEIDALQFQPSWQRTPDADLRRAIGQVQRSERWLIDGFGPWDQIEERAQLADTTFTCGRGASWATSGRPHAQHASSSVPRTAAGSGRSLE